MNDYLRRERVEVAGGKAWIEFSEPTYGLFRHHLQPPVDAAKRSEFALQIAAKLITGAGGDWDSLGVGLPPALTPVGRGKWLDERLALIDALSIGDYVRIDAIAARLNTVEPTETESRQSSPPSESSTPGPAASGATA
jgi:hypothetical protein